MLNEEKMKQELEEAMGKVKQELKHIKYDLRAKENELAKIKALLGSLNLRKPKKRKIKETTINGDTGI